MKKRNYFSDIEDRNENAFSVIADFGNVVLDILDAAIITHRYIVKRYMPQTGMFLYSTRQSKFRMEYPQTHLTRKTGMMHKFR